MKRLVLFLVFGACLGSCTNSGDHKSTSSDSLTTGHDHTNNTSSDTSSMMGIMNAMMNSMMAIPSTNDADIDFANLMNAHHKSAVQMARLELISGQDASIKKIAQKLVGEQQKEIAFFTQYVAANKTDSSSNTFYMESMDRMHHMPMNVNNNATIDVQFVQLMLPHHQGAIEMAEIYLKHTQDTSLAKIAREIITSQQKEIQQFNDWMSRL